MNGLAKFSYKDDEVTIEYECFDSERVEFPFEEWRAIRETDLGEFFEVSNYGRVRNKITNTMLKPYLNGHYKRYCFGTNIEKSKNRYAHRLVAEAFLDDVEDKEIVNHIDENKMNNHVSNLEWVTYKENANHGTRNSRISKTRKKKKYGAKSVVIEFNEKYFKYGFLNGKNEIEFDRVQDAKMFCKLSGLKGIEFDSLLKGDTSNEMIRINYRESELID